LTRNELVLSENQALGLGGTCYGDSGGPTLFEGTIMGVTHGGDTPCRSYENFQRLDTPGVRAFLAHFLALP
jgi:secreted trypsin-like serine protease